MVLIKVRHPGGVDPAAASGTMTVTLLDAASGKTLREKQIATKSLGSEQGLLEGLDLVEGTRYQVRLQARFDAKESLCASSTSGLDRRGVGQSPVFAFTSSVNELSIYFDCADSSSAAGTPLAKRLYHTATFVADPGPHGQVIIAGGADPASNLEDPNTVKIYSSIESYDPESGTYKLLDAQLSQPRMIHTATANGTSEVLIAAGANRTTVGSAATLSSMKTVERIKDGRVVKLADARENRALHGAALVGKALVLVGGFRFYPLPMVSVELYDVAAQTSQDVTMPLARVYPTVVPFSDGRRALIAGGLRLANQDVQHVILCASGTCACGTPPCLEKIGGFGTGLGRYGAVGARVDCGTTRSAIYIVGGNYKDGTTKVDTYYDDIYCLDQTAPTSAQRVGALKNARVGHTVTPVRGPKGSWRLFVAGGNGKTSTGQDAIWDTAELMDVTCDCKVSNPREVKLQAQRTGHTATLLADGTVLLLDGLAVGLPAERFNPNY